jgi:hypothetical protein
MREDENETTWQDECFATMRLITSAVAERTPLIKDKDTPAGWALADLRTLNRELLQALEEVDIESAESLLREARSLLVEVLRLAG